VSGSYLLQAINGSTYSVNYIPGATTCFGDYSPTSDPNIIVYAYFSDGFFGIRRRVLSTSADLAINIHHVFRLN
jgi:hypothetical protein